MDYVYCIIRDEGDPPICGVFTKLEDAEKALVNLNEQSLADEKMMTELNGERWTYRYFQKTEYTIEKIALNPTEVKHERRAFKHGERCNIKKDITIVNGSHNSG